MKTTIRDHLTHRLAGGTPVPHFVALLSILREAADRHLALLPEEPKMARRHRR